MIVIMKPFGTYSPHRLHETDHDHRPCCAGGVPRYDDQALVRAGLRALLEKTDDLEIVGPE
jgi:hypothetical protein